MDLVRNVVQEICPGGTEADDEPVQSASSQPVYKNGSHAPKAEAPAPPAAKAEPPPEPKAAQPTAKAKEEAPPEPPKKARHTPAPIVPPADSVIPAAKPEEKAPPAAEPPPAAESSPAEPPKPEEADIAVPDPEVFEEEALPNGHKEVGAVFFFPASKNDELETVHRKFQEVIKKHKLKFKLKRVHSHPYEVGPKINYASFVEVCKDNRVPVAIVIGPPPGGLIPEQDFYDLLSVTLDVQGVSLQLVNWTEINKDYRYLNLALDIALVRTK